MSKFHFIKNKKVTLIILAAVVVIGLLSFLIRGFNIDIDFAGGTEIKIDLGTEVNDEVVADIEKICDDFMIIVEEADEAAKKDEVVIDMTFSSVAQSESDKNMVIIRTSDSLDAANLGRFKGIIATAYPEADLDNGAYDSIAPTIGADLTKTALISVAVAVVLMLIYITIRFQLTSGIAAVICLTHDLFVMLAVYSLFQIPVNSNIIAAMLTILGYSINATIIVFDRIRENKKNDKEGKSFGELVNDGIHDTLGRSFNTTVTTLLTIGMIWLLGVDSIKDFAFPLIVGIVAGLFSSVFVSGMLWDMLNKLLPGKKAKK